MKYMLSTYGSAEQDFGISGWSNDEMTAMVGFMQKIDEELRESGELVDEEGLTDASHAKVIEVRDGVPW